MAAMEQMVIGLVMGAGGALVFYFGFNKWRKWRLIEDTPRSKVRSMAMGLVEIQGSAEAESFLTSPFSRKPCVYYKYDVQEYRKHVSRGPKGQVRTSYSWDTIAAGDRATPFYAKDDTGRAYVDPAGAEVHTPLSGVYLQRSGVGAAFPRILGLLDAWHSGREREMDVSGWSLTPLKPGAHRTWGASVGDRKYFEYLIEPGENVFVLGTASIDPKAPGGVSVKKGDNERTFMISDRSETDLVRGLKWETLGWFAGGAIIVVIGALISVNVVSLG
ncbi:MAG: hypothetical protein HY556_07220 [Euryarchaeota archaeon]|nr:hypothetical protein [Euryarchaeota archaeon]